jgi:hypothetical protein
MRQNKFSLKWSEIMAKLKNAVHHLKKKKEIRIELIPVYIPDSEFQEKKIEIQNLIAKILITAHKRGRPSKYDEEEFNYAA